MCNRAGFVRVGLYQVLVAPGWPQTIQRLFDRYDVDATGLITEDENLSQLTINIMVKFSIRMPSEVPSYSSFPYMLLPHMLHVYNWLAY